MLPELHAVKMLFYAESVGVVTSGHVTKMAVTPFNPLLYANLTALSSTELQLLPINFFASWEWGFSRFFAKNNGKYNISHLCCKIDADDAETLLLACYRLF